MENFILLLFLGVLRIFSHKERKWIKTSFYISEKENIINVEKVILFL